MTVRVPDSCVLRCPVRGVSIEQIDVLWTAPTCGCDRGYWERGRLILSSPSVGHFSRRPLATQPFPLVHVLGQEGWARSGSWVFREEEKSECGAEVFDSQRGEGYSPLDFPPGRLVPGLFGDRAMQGRCTQGVVRGGPRGQATDLNAGRNSGNWGCNQSRRRPIGK